MTTVLAIDAAWGAAAASGVALVRRVGERWRAIAVAPSYDSFVALAAGRAVEWGALHAGSEPDVDALLAAARTLADSEIDVATVDMPVATVPIVGRRSAESAIGRTFGARHCSCHSPSVERPGRIGATLTEAFARNGFRVAGSDVMPGERGRLVEVYPHPALLTLLDAPRRVPYKYGKLAAYWPHEAPHARRERLLAQWAAIRGALDGEIDGIKWPRVDAAYGGRRMKQLEDAMDAVVCAWVGACYVEGRARPYGDETAAIWCPTGRLWPALGLSA